MSEPQDHYAVLGIADSASADEIRSAFRAAAKREHPDLFPMYAQKLRATVQMRRLLASYAVLRDPQQRAEYDRTRRAQAEVQHRARLDRHEPTMPLSRVTGDAEYSRWILAGWFACGAACATGLWYFDPPRSISGFLYLGAMSLVAGPIIVGLALLALIVPAGVVAIGFGEAFRDFRTSGRPQSTLRVLVDALGRLAGLAGTVWLLVKLFNWGVQFDLLYYVLLAFGGGCAGELAALVAYIAAGRSVARRASALVVADQSAG